MKATTFNQAQRHILQMMSYIKDEQQIVELDRIISDYFAKKADKELNSMIAVGEITPETIENWGKEHLRTPYK